MKDLGRRVRARRLALGKSQTAVASAVSRGHAWLSALENGKGGEVPAEVIVALAVELAESPAEYLRLAGRAVLRAEDVLPVELDPRVLATIEKAVDRAFDRFGDRLVERLAELLQARPVAQ